MRVHSTKFNGSLHYTYPLQPIYRTGDVLITHSFPGVPVDSYRGAWVGNRNLLSFFWRERAYVAHVVWNGDWVPHQVYVDIATRTEWDENTVRYVDMDLDVYLRHGATQVVVDDVEEFEINRVKWAYPPDLVARCHSTVRDVCALFASRARPFTPEMFDWRPGLPVSL